MDKSSIIRFINCTCCNKNYSTDLHFWADLEKRLCKCCECSNYNAVQTQLCKRKNCKMHQYIDADFISLNEKEMVEMQEIYEIKPPLPYNENDFICLFCDKEINTKLDIYFSINCKVSMLHGDKITRQRNKFKLCSACYIKYFNRLKQENIDEHTKE
jgi:hypothetical protein